MLKSVFSKKATLLKSIVIHDLYIWLNNSEPTLTGLSHAYFLFLGQVVRHAETAPIFDRIALTKGAKLINCRI
jgi:hypothetical protein